MTGDFMAGNFLAGNFMGHRVTFGDFMAGNVLAGDFLGGYIFSTCLLMTLHVYLYTLRIS